MNQALQDLIEHRRTTNLFEDIIEHRRTTNVFEPNHTISDEQIEQTEVSFA